MSQIIDTTTDTAIHVDCAPGKISDGYHTFDELYDHRIELYLALAREIRKEDLRRWRPEKGDFEGSWSRTWRSKVHSDGSVMDGWFVLGIGKEAGKQITYHLPLSRWDETDFAETLDKAPTYDGHTSQDVIDRLKKL